MTTIAQAIQIRDGFILPEDLSVYMGKKTLVKLILEAIEDLNARTSGRDSFTRGTPERQPALMLTLLTYCYATGVYASADIELNMEYDPMTRYLCAKSYLGLPALREFRRYNRDRIKECLAIVLRRVWELRFCDQNDCPLAAAGGPVIPGWPGWRPAPDFVVEAEQRIFRAVQADSMALDW